MERMFYQVSCDLRWFPAPVRGISGLTNWLNYNVYQTAPYDIRDIQFGRRTEQT